MKQKILLMLAILGIIFVSGCVQTQNSVTDNKTSIAQCVDELKQKNYDYQQGNLIVGFEEQYTEKNISDILSEYDLNVSEYWSICNCAKVDVSKGTEFEWVCRLKEDNRIKFPELNLKSHTTVDPADDLCSSIKDAMQCVKNEQCEPLMGPSACSPDGKTCTADMAFKKCISKNNL